MRCPYCSELKGRMLLHRHLLDSHADEVELDGAVYRLDCPRCSETVEVDVSQAPGVSEEEARGYADDVTVMAFDVLLDHMEDSHQ